MEGEHSGVTLADHQNKKSAYRSEHAVGLTPDVVIEYEPIANAPGSDRTFSSVVYYHAIKASDDSAPSTVKGTETLSAG